MLRPVALGLLLCLVPPARGADLDIEVRGVKVRSGQIQAGLFANAEDFTLDIALRATISPEGRISAGVYTREDQMPRPAAATASAPVQGRTVILRIADVEPGDYSLALYQDVNDDGKLDMSLSGTPLEPWGMSNNPRVSDRAPVWEEGRFTLPAEGMRLVIELQ